MNPERVSGCSQAFDFFDSGAGHLSAVRRRTAWAQASLGLD
jgi:hypothetical protein